MDLQAKHKNKLIYFKTQVVNKVEDIRKKMIYGEGCTCCVSNLYAAIKLINRLDCYCFPSVSSVTTTTNGVYTLVASTLIDEAIGTYYLYNGDIVIAVKTTVGVVNEAVLAGQLLTLADISFTSTEDEFGDVHFLVSVDCSISNLYISNSIGDPAIISFVKQTLPICEFVYTECFNCNEDDELNKLYQIVQSLLK